MNRKEYRLIADAIGRTNIVNNMERNAVKRNAKNASLRLFTIDITATLRHEYPNFNEAMFLTACGMEGLK